AFAEDGAAGDRFLIATGPENFVECLPLLFGPIQILAMTTDHRTGDRRLGLVGFCIAQEKSHRRALLTSQLSGSSRSSAERHASGEFFTVTQTHHKQLSRSNPRWSEQGNEFVFFSSDFLPLEELGQ